MLDFLCLESRECLLGMMWAAQMGLLMEQRMADLSADLSVGLLAGPLVGLLVGTRVRLLVVQSANRKVRL